jgi:hypothetical protein
MFSGKNGETALAVIALLFGVLLMFTLPGCDSGGNGGKGGNNYGDEDLYPYGKGGTGWPSSKLSTYGLGGMSQPAGMSNIQWWEYEDYTGYEYPVIYISFNGTANSDAAIKQYFSGSGWTAEGYSYEGMSAFSYTKGTAAAYYYFDSSSSTGLIVAGYPTD